MIAALAALPMVQGLVGGVVGGVMNAFTPAEPAAPAAANTLPFSSALSSATSAFPAAPSTTSPGLLRADQWNQMSDATRESWAQGLTGHHIDATDAAGHAVSGTVQSVQQNGHMISLHVNGHIVSLSDLKQISWSATAA